MWTFIHPLALTMIFMLVFGLGFRSHAPIGEVPFVVWFLCGLFSWTFFSETVAQNTRIFNTYSYMVKKVNFRLSIIPLVKIFSNSVLHFIYLFFLVVVLLLLYSIPITIYWLQLIYYFAAMLLLTTGVSWLVSSINVFVKDVGQAMSIIIRLGFFATPIFWKIENVADQYQFIFLLNPMYYILQGYRDSFINQVPFWEHPGMTFYFWGFTAVTLVVGIIVFIRLRPHFADVL